MNSKEIIQLPADFDPRSRAWIYQGHRPFTPEEATDARRLLGAFTGSWNSHGHPVKGYAGIWFDQFVVLLADETQADVSGCSTDSSVQVIRQIEQQSGVRLFDRLDLAFLVAGKVLLIPMARLSAALQAGTIDGATPYFNNTVQTKQELEDKWLIQMKDSWLGQRHLQVGDAVPAK